MYREQPQSSTPLDQLEQMAINIVYTVSSIVCMPVEILLRWQYGTRYFPVYVSFFSAGLLILLSTFGSIATGVTQMIPFAHFGIPVGVFDLWSLTKLFFVLTFFVHGPRLWRRMLYMELEALSRFEGPALPFYALLPGGRAFNFVRIVLEPLTVIAVTMLLKSFDIITSGLAAYLYLCSIMLAMKCYVLYLQAWQFARDIRDAEGARDIFTRLSQGNGNAQDLNQMHLASLPKNEEDRKKLLKLMNDKWNSTT